MSHYQEQKHLIGHCLICSGHSVDSHTVCEGLSPRGFKALNGMLLELNLDSLRNHSDNVDEKHCKAACEKPTMDT